MSQSMMDFMNTFELQKKVCRDHRGLEGELLEVSQPSCKLYMKKVLFSSLSARNLGRRPMEPMLNTQEGHRGLKISPVSPRRETARICSPCRL